MLINGKEANWDGDDPLPFTAAHLLQLPDLIWGTLSPGQQKPLEHMSKDEKDMKNMIKYNLPDVL